MNWEAIGAVGEVLGALGVLITLVYLSIQVRSNTAETHNATIESVMTSDANHRTGLVNGPVPRIMAAVQAGTPEEKLVITYYLQSYLQGWEVAFYLNLRSSLPDDVLQAIAFRRLATLDTLEGTLRWSDMSAAYTPDFQAHVEEQITIFNSKPKPWETS